MGLIGHPCPGLGLPPPPWAMASPSPLHPGPSLRRWRPLGRVRRPRRPLGTRSGRSVGDPWGAWSHCGADAARQRERNCREHALHGNSPRRALSGPPGSPGVRVVLSLMTEAPAVYAIGDGEVLFLEGSAVIFPQTLRHSVLPPPGRAPPPPRRNSTHRLWADGVDLCGALGRAVPFPGLDAVARHCSRGGGGLGVLPPPRGRLVCRCPRPFVGWPLADRGRPG